MPLTIISSVPSFVTADRYAEITSQTPQSFSDIPTVVRLQVSDVSVDLQPALPQFTPEDGQSGTLYVLESVLVFMSTTGKGLQIDYRTITLHAVSRTNDKPCIYCQLDTEGLAATEEDMVLAELNILPSKVEDLESIFEALSYCATLHPDPATSEDDDEDDAFISSDSPFEVFDPENEQQELSEVGRAALEHLESIIDYSNVPSHLRPGNGTSASTPTTNGRPDNASES